jgi:acyl-CoA reductase-like NAD-dependent aldehyde dehydrogenase
MNSIESKTITEISDAFAAQRAASREFRPSTIRERTAKLTQLQHVVQSNYEDLATAVSSDFGHRSKHETKILEVFTVLEAIRSARRNLWRWARPEFRPASIFYLPSVNRIISQPLGVIGIVAPFNFPLLLSLGPMVSALAAGNHVMLKMSELSPHTCHALTTVLGSVFEESEVHISLGGETVSRVFCSLPFDHLFFTGSSATGAQVMQTAARNLTPVTLELGGKNPAVFDRNINWRAMIKRLFVGKTLNAGQICVAPDYALVPKGTEQRFCELAAMAVSELYPTLRNNPDYSCIISDLHYQRLAGLLDDARRKGATLVELNPAGEDLPASDRKLSPLIVLNTTPEMAVSQEEIFGPVLPLVSYESLDKALDYINDRPRPLALYCFSRNKRFTTELITCTNSGSVGINTCVRHAGQDDLPFGGVGQSGFGRYHGRDGFMLFSNPRGVMYEGTYTSFALFYPPYGRLVDFLLKLMLNWRK